MSNHITSENYSSYLEVKEIPSLNGWRAIAVTLVILGHLKVMLIPNDILYKILDNFVYPEFGVRIFFVLSGFLITTLLIKEIKKTGRINILNFFIRRFLRIVPALWLYLLTIAVLNHVFNFELTFSHFLGPLLYLNNFNIFPRSWIIGHTWSLAVEEQFYLIWPFIFYLLKNLLFVCLFFIVYTSIVITIVYFKPQLSQVLLEPFLQPAAAIFTGAALAIIWSKNFYHINIRNYLKNYFFLLSVLAILTIYILKHYGLLSLILYSGGDTILNLIVAYLIVFSIVKKQGIVYTILNKKILVNIGLLSYSLYLWQQVFIIPAGAFTNWSRYFFFPFNILAIAVVAYFSHHYFEKPFLKLKQRFSFKHV